MTENENECFQINDLLEDAIEEMSPSDDPSDLDPDYPPDLSSEDRVLHVLISEFPRWRTIEWIGAAADTTPQNCRSVIMELLSTGEVELSDRGIRRNRYHVYFEEIQYLTEEVIENPEYFHP